MTPQGLSLSTEGETASAETAGADGVSGARIAELTIAITLSGLILLAARVGRPVPVPEKLEEMGRRL